MTSSQSDRFWAADFQTPLEMFQKAAARHPQRVFCKTPEITLTYAAAAGAVQAMAERLGAGAGVRGAAVALILPNSPQFLIAYFGALSAGARPALVNYGHPGATVAKLLSDLDVAEILTDRTDIAGLRLTPFGLEDLAALAAQGSADTRAPVGDPEATGAILFTGGTTGLPKRIAHSNDVLVKKIERMEWGWPTRDEEIWLPVAPFTHIYGFLMGVLNPVLRGGTLVIPPRFHPDLIVSMLSEEKVTVFGGGPPAIYQALMASADFAEASFEALRICPGGGAPFPLDVHQRWEAATGLPITEGYGMTEIAPIAVNTEAAGMKPGSAGKPVPDTIIEIADLTSGEGPLPAGQIGEIRIRGPHQMTEYEGNAEETAIALRGGYVYTGDIGTIDETGFLIISDRKKDVLFVKGFNVFPREVEEALMGHEAVSAACVVGRKDARAGERPVAFVTLAGDVAPGALAAHCEALLSDYKHPAEIIVLDSMPLTPAGKADRTKLRDRVAEGAQT